MGRRELVDLTLQLHHETERAILVSDSGDRDDAVWLPLNQIEVAPGVRPWLVDVMMPEWLAQDRGLI